MYTTGVLNKKVYQYNLSTAWDITTAVYFNALLVTTRDTDPQGLAFSADGKTMILLGSQNDRLYNYDLGMAWDIGTATFAADPKFYVGSQDTLQVGFTFSVDGSKLYTNGGNNDRIYQYNLSTPWTVSSASYVTSVSISGSDSTTYGVTFSDTGKKMFFVGDASNKIFQWNLSTAWDITTARAETSFSVATQDTSPTNVTFDADGSNMYVVGTLNNKVYQYKLL
jgi:sugar lactone lactonase YvrE